MRLGGGALAPVLCAALGCGPAQRPARPEPTPGRIARFQPLEMQRDARQRGQAVILGTDADSGSTVLAIPLGATVVVVHATSVRHAGAGPMSGDVQAVVVTSAARPPGALGGTGPVQPGGADDAAPAARWRAGVWSAALVAAAALGKDLDDLALETTPAGPIEGTASALIAAGFVAALTGDTIDPAATLAGAIQPDGAIGPVAGLPEQIAAAIAHGKTRIGYPGGMRVARSAATGGDVDLVELARSHHAEAIELADVHDAYQLLTGHRLPATVPVTVAAMALDPATLERLEASYAAWQQRLAAEWAPLLQLEQAGRMPPVVAAMVRAAHARSERAEGLHRSAALAAADREMRSAWLQAAAANQIYALVGKLGAGDVDGAVAALAALDPGDASVRAIFARIGKIGDTEPPPATLAGHLALLDALGAGLRGWAYHDLAGDSLHKAAQLLGQLQGKPPAELGAPGASEAASAVIAPAVLGLLRAAAEVAIAEQALEPGLAGGVACRCPPARLLRAATVLQAAAVAAAGHLDALVVDPLARKLGAPPDVARRRVATLDPDYLMADLPRSAAAGLPHELAEAWGDGSLAAGLLAIAGGQAAYHSAALMIAKYDSLGIHSDDAGRIEAMNHPQAFRKLLATAERSARAAAHAAQIATGAVPAQARLAYQRAAVDAAGDLADQVEALADLWTATALSDTAVLLARTCDPSPR